MFIGSPVPMKRHDSAERSAMLTMAYFHPWSLRASDAQGSVVPFAGNLRDRQESWQCALSTWLNGNVVSQESVRYINIFNASIVFGFATLTMIFCQMKISMMKSWS